MTGGCWLEQPPRRVGGAGETALPTPELADQVPQSAAIVSIRTEALPREDAEDEGVRILVRTTVLATGWVACLWGLAQVSNEDGGANIGVGLLLFALLTLVAGAWGAVDGARQAYDRVVITWVAVALLMAVLVPLFTYLRESGSAWRVLLVDLAQLGPFIAVLITVPALVGALLGRAVGGPDCD